MLKQIIAGIALIALFAGCTPPPESQEPMSTTPMADAVATHPSTSMRYYEKEVDGRLFVIGKEETLQRLNDNGHIPYAKTLIGEGPNGKTLVVEIDKKDPALQANLLAMYRAKHPYYRVAEMHGRVFVLGNPETFTKLLDNGHIPYARTLIGMGPAGETVVVEIDKENPSMVDRLQQQYSNNYYSETEKHGRIFLVGSPEMRQKLISNGHIPYARTFIGAGKGGATVVVEIDKDNAALTDRLVAEYESRHGVSLN